MTHDASPEALLDDAAGHLQAAADFAEARGGSDVFSEWHGLAGQISLTASGVSHFPAVPAQPPASISEGLTAAIDTLECIAPLSGPPDLVLWIWHVRELLRLALEMGQ